MKVYQVLASSRYASRYEPPQLASTCATEDLAKQMCAWFELHKKREPMIKGSKSPVRVYLAAHKLWEDERAVSFKEARLYDYIYTIEVCDVLEVAPTVKGTT